MWVLGGSVLLFGAALYAAFSTHGFLRLSFLLFAVWWLLHMGEVRGMISFAPGSPLHVLPAACIVGAAVSFIAGVLFDTRRADA